MADKLNRRSTMRLGDGRAIALAALTHSPPAAQDDLVIAYANAAGHAVTNTVPVDLSLTGTGATPLRPGVYESTAHGAFQINTGLTLDFQGDPDAVFILQGTELTTAAGAAGSVQIVNGGAPTWSSPSGVGAPSTPSPAGQFWIRSRLRGLSASPAYGPYAFGTAAYSVLTDWPGGSVIGIHGSDEPQLIPGRPSHDCVRVPNAAITRRWRLMAVGTPVVIL